MASKSKPQRTDVVIIGAGASGATAAKVLCEAGINVVALEKGPWRAKESFGGDELANINRYNLWPDPLLNPRTWRETAGDAARLENFCPVPQMVGGGTVALAGLAAALHPERFPHADRRGRPARREPRRLADLLRGPRALLPEGRVGVRRVGRGRGQPLRGGGARAATLARRCRCRATPRSSCRVATRSAGTPFRPRRPRCRAPSTAAGPPSSAPSLNSTATRPARARRP